MKNTIKLCYIFLFITFTLCTSNAQRIDVDGIPSEHGIHVNNPGLSGLRIFSPGEMGVYVDFAPHHGFFSYGSGDSGLHTYGSADDGAQLYNSADDGLHIKNSGGQGIEIDSGVVGMMIHHQTIGISMSKVSNTGISINEGITGITLANQSGNSISVSNPTQDGLFVFGPAQNGIRIANAGSDGINVSNSTEHGVEISSGLTGLYVHDQTNHGVYSDNNGREAGFFRSPVSSTYPTIYASHSDDDIADISLGGNGRIEADGDVQIQLDDNDNGLNEFFEVRASPTSGGFVFYIYEDGNGGVVGNFSKGGGSFKIDHPLDPQNKYLYHSFVESPDMMNVYNGNVVLDENGEAYVSMEDWFDALNRDFRYQLTSIGTPGPDLYIADKINGNTFRIAGGTPGAEVSWQVTGIRQDPFAEQNRIQIEVDKESYNKGKYLHPEAYQQVGRGSNLQHVTLSDPAEPMEIEQVEE